MGIEEKIEALKRSQTALAVEFERPLIRCQALAYLSEIGFPDHADILATLQADTWAQTRANLDEHFNSPHFRIIRAMRRVPSITSQKQE